MTNDNAPDRATKIVLLLLVLVPVLFNAFMLTPELRSIPSKNDDRLQYMLVQRASAALTEGDNPVDFWVPDVALGFPQFLYYQHVPHLAVVALHRLLFKQVDLLRLFNLVRYLLLVLFPLTVYWSARKMDFSVGAAAVAAAFASLLSGQSRLDGFDYDSYLWSGHGMYTQLWGMHLFFLSIACIYRAMSKGFGYLSAIVFSSLLLLSHVLYAYMAALSVFALLLATVVHEHRRS
ncbi:MAG TPA: hypothetical protein VIX59_10745 [Candidatus Binataceae bacterium]